MKPVFFLIHLALAGLAAYQGYTLFYPHSPEPETAVVDTQEKRDTEGKNESSVPKTKGPAGQMEATVIKRNLFKVMIDPPRAGQRQNEETTRPRPEKTNLKLALLGTVAGVTPSRNWAVIEDLKTRQQDLYIAGDRVLGAEIKEVSRNRVILTVDGKDQILEAQTKPSSGMAVKKESPGLILAPGPDGPQAVRREETDNLFDSLKFRPYMKDGSPSGVLIYGIRPGSQLLSAGLKNGDIIHTINETEINDSNDLKEITQTLTADQEISISLSRRGQDKEIFYKGANE